MAKVIKIITWNINGSQNPVKRKKWLSYLKTHQTDIALIQETHMEGKEADKLKRDWVGQVFHNSYSSKKNGVAILVHKRLNLVMLNQKKDDEGRMICIHAAIDGVKINICNVYAPNRDDSNFFHMVNKTLGELDDAQTVIGGDFNQVQDAHLDRTTYHKTVPKDRLAIQLMMKDHGLVDIWRLVNPREKEYTFFSHVHKSHSRIDYFLVSRKSTEMVGDCKIGAIALSDHAPVELIVKLKSSRSTGNRWRLNASLLQDPTFKTSLDIYLRDFFDLNVGSTKRIASVWEASKAYIRGYLISQSSYRKKMANLKIKDLESQIKNKETELAQCYSEHRFKEVCNLKYQLNEIFNKKAEYALFRLKTNFYESGEKAGKLLATQLKRKDASLLIPAINNDKGEVLTDNVEINRIFKDFYENLYRSEMSVDQAKYADFFSKIDIPEVSQTQVNMLDAPIDESEVRAAILTMKSQRSPGLDGFCAEYYKVNIDLLAPILTKVYTEALEVGLLPPTFNDAVITILLKKEKDPYEPSSYRPISLENVDCKILSKVLAMRLEKVLPKIINEDQVGFIKGRSSADNLRRLLHLMWINHKKEAPIAAFSLDAMKAFDRVEWGYLIYTLQAFGFGEGFIKWVKVLYSAPRAAVLTNGTMSPFFHLGRGTRQGDPLSPLLFTLFVEPLAVAIRDDLNIKGVMAGGQMHKMFLYADDILLILSDPASSIPGVMDIIENFSKMSGYKINWQKSEVMPVSVGCSIADIGAFPFTWIPSGMKYLGIRLTTDFQTLVQINMDPVLQNIKTNFAKWKMINLSLWGKINTVKMMVSSKINYISMMIPLTIPESLFKQYNDIVRDYLWDGKKPRISLNKLFTTRDRGGLALPNIELYNISFELVRLCEHWSERDSTLGWLEIEKSLTFPFSYIDALSQKLANAHLVNPILQHSRDVWNKIHKLLRLSQYKQSYSSIWENPAVKIGKKTVFWRTWYTKGIATIRDVFEEGILYSFQGLKEKYNLNDKGDFWKYLQLRSCVLSTGCNTAQVESVLQNFLKLPKMVQSSSVFYKMAANALYGESENLRIIWQKDLGIEMEQEVWENIVHNMGWPVRDIKTKFIHYKIIHKYYWTPVRLKRLGLIQSNECWKCKSSMGTFLHLMWDCPLVSPFWARVIGTMEEWLEQPLPSSPRLFLLGDKTVLTAGLSKAQLGLALAGSLNAAKVILRKWKITSAPCYKDWIELMTSTASYELMLAKVGDSVSKFSAMWDSFLTYIKDGG